MGKNFKKVEKVLAIETSGKVFSIALAESSAPPLLIAHTTRMGGQANLLLSSYRGSPQERQRGEALRGELFLDIGLKHSEVLKEACATLLSQCNWEMKDLTALTVCTGPGSFTGLRVGISFARALCQNLKLPLVGVPAFEVVHAGFNTVFQATVKNRAEVHCVLIDSVSKELFAGFFKLGQRESIEPFQVYPIQELFKKLQGFSKIWIAGDGFLRYQQEFRDRVGKRLLPVPEEFHFARARHLAILALEKLKVSNAKRFSWEKVVPFYLRPPLAEERLNKRN